MHYEEYFYQKRLIPFLKNIFTEIMETEKEGKGTLRNYFGLDGNIEQKKQAFKVKHHAQFYGPNPLFKTKEESEGFVQALFSYVQFASANNIPIKNYFFPDEKGDFSTHQGTLFHNFAERLANSIELQPRSSETKVPTESKVQKTPKASHLGREKTPSFPSFPGFAGSSEPELFLSIQGDCEREGLTLTAPLQFDDRTGTVNGVAKTKSGEELAFQWHFGQDGLERYQFMFLDLPNDADTVRYSGKSFSMPKDELWRMQHEPAKDLYDEKSHTRSFIAKTPEHVEAVKKERIEAKKVSEPFLLRQYRKPAPKAIVTQKMPVIERLKEMFKVRFGEVGPRRTRQGELHQNEGISEGKGPAQETQVPQRRSIFPTPSPSQPPPRRGGGFMPTMRRPKKKQKSPLGKIVAGSIGGFVGGIGALAGFEIFF